jgi:hypothetical protein
MEHLHLTKASSRIISAVSWFFDTSCPPVLSKHRTVGIKTQNSCYSSKWHYFFGRLPKLYKKDTDLEIQTKNDINFFDNQMKGTWMFLTEIAV